MTLNPSFISLVFLFLIAPFYLHPNIGGLGFGIPINSAEWLVALIFICIATLRSMQQQKIQYHQGFIYCLILPLTLIFIGMASDVPMPVVWFFRQLYILGGFAFLWALFQLELTTKQTEQLLYSIVIATFFHSLIGLCQLWHVFFPNIWIARQLDVPIGVFQQVNVQATYLSTGLLVILYLISRPSFNTARFVTQFFFIVTFGLGLYVVLSTGSRVGLLSLVSGAILLFLSRRKQLLRNKKILACLVIVASLSTIAGQSGFSRTLDKTHKMTEGEYASARQTMYAIGLNLIKDKPIFGYGIGSFPRVWVEQKAEFLAQHPDAAITSATTSHPHNEILFWFIEGGLIAVAGLVVILVVVCRAIYQCGFSRGGAYMAMLFPITLHTQVELPFYISSVHWFLWLFLIYLVFRHQLKTVPLKISKMALTSLQAFILVLGLAGSAMLIHIEKAEREIFKYMYATGGNLQFALHDFYFNRFAEKLLMQSLLYQSIEHHDTSKIPLFIDWAEKAIKQNPELGMFIMLSDAYGFIGNKARQCQVAKKGTAIYPPNERLQKTAKQCL